MLRRASAARSRSSAAVSYTHLQPLHLAQKIGCDALHPHKAFATKALVRRAHAAGIKVNAWTVDEEKDVIQMLENGVDGIITDRPDYVESVVDRYLAEHK